MLFDTEPPSQSDRAAAFSLLRHPNRGRYLRFFGHERWIAALGACAGGLETAADPLHCRHANSKPSGYLAHALSAPRPVEGVTPLATSPARYVSSTVSQTTSASLGLQSNKQVHPTISIVQPSESRRRSNSHKQPTLHPPTEYPAE
jgi:hypothetical protein